MRTHNYALYGLLSALCRLCDVVVISLIYCDDNHILEEVRRRGGESKTSPRLKVEED